MCHNRNGAAVAVVRVPIVDRTMSSHDKRPDTVHAPLLPTVCIFFTLFFTAIYIVERLVLQTIYVLNKVILQFLGLKSAVYNLERVILAHVR